jgi:hypothetical protein
MTTMVITSFDKTNMDSKKVRAFKSRLSYLLIAYIAVAIFFQLGVTEMIISFMESDLPVAQSLFRVSLVFLVITAIFYVTFLELKWQILRTVILATSWLSIAYLGCAILMLIWPVSSIHLIILSFIGILFLAIFLFESNIRIYWRDRTYGDVMIEAIIAIIFLVSIGRMIAMALA